MACKIEMSKFPPTESKGAPYSITLIRYYLEDKKKIVAYWEVKCRGVKKCFSDLGNARQFAEND